MTKRPTPRQLARVARMRAYVAQRRAAEPPEINLRPHPLALAVHLALREWHLHRGR